MNRQEALEALRACNMAISTSAMLLGHEHETLERFMRESRDMESFGPIVDPTLFRSEERRATEAMLKPIYKAALDFLRVHETQMAAVKAALEKVTQP